MALVTAAAATIGTMTLTTSSASAQGYWAEKCGPGFSYYGTAPMWPERDGHLRVFKRHKGAYADWCALTIKHKPAYGNRSWTAVKIRRGQSGSWDRIDRGHFKYYAGPVHIWNARTITTEGRMTWDGVSSRASAYAHDPY